MPPLELRKWFQVTTGLTSAVLAAACSLTVYRALPPDDASAKLALILMYLGAQPGFVKILQLFLPLLLLKLWPSLETDRSSQGG